MPALGDSSVAFHPVSIVPMPSSEFRFVLHWPTASGFVNESFAWRPFDYGQFPAAVGMGPLLTPTMPAASDSYPLLVYSRGHG